MCADHVLVRFDFVGDFEANCFGSVPGRRGLLWGLYLGGLCEGWAGGVVGGGCRCCRCGVRRRDPVREELSGEFPVSFEFFELG